MAFAILLRNLFILFDLQRSPMSMKFMDMFMFLFLIAYAAAPIPSAKRELIVLFMLYHLEHQSFVAYDVPSLMLRS
jgi:hypothetical protein